MTTKTISSVKKSSPRKGRKAEFPASVPMTPVPPLFVPPPPKPLDQAEVRRNAEVVLKDGRAGVVVATGAHRVRIQWVDGSPSGVVLRGQIEAVVAAAPTPKTSSRKAGPKVVRLTPGMGLEVLATALLEYATANDPAVVVQALERALAVLAKQ